VNIVRWLVLEWMYTQSKLRPFVFKTKSEEVTGLVPLAAAQEKEPAP
jgi:hypothetical protein